MSVEKGKITVIVGPNGSGKSTMLKTIAGVTTITEGSITLDGEKISGLRAHSIAKLGLAYLPQTESVFTRLKVSENIRMAAYTIDGALYRERLKEVLSVFPQIVPYMETSAQNLSGGERQMVAMAMALIRKPKMIMLDEPTANLSPKIATSVLKTVQALSADLGMTVLLVEQNAKKALEMGDSAFLFVGGKKAFEGRCADLLQHPEFARMYLGLKAI